jgi:hypothetical protein
MTKVRNISATAATIRAALRSEQLAARPGVIPAYTVSASALLAVLSTMAVQTEVLAGQVEQGFGQHPDAEIYRSQPGLGVILGARMLGPSSATTQPATPTLRPGRTTPAYHRSPKPPGRSGSCSPASPATAASAMHCSCRPSPHSTIPPAPAPSTTDSAPAAPPATKPSEPSQTGSSASSTAAYEPTPPLRRTPRLAHRTRQTQLGGLTASSGGMSSQPPVSNLWGPL